ncbi:hypothetical protein C2E20_0772 [Micractinium conductrix]|uniref:Coenzyme Q-binding protein COQ10 START domain-containing protein n=1 Tax=Micractinium conductrix TaxID=554055 RepID=A0A2P6VR42_9CHLO|nr:hypothetical protein C2E20_0772 [Micractinium conductrix]|eukprot:PSC76568.1 hypothetical protein C2E20_0772 [Micractinium conductrix]
MARPKTGETGEEAVEAPPAQGDITVSTFSHSSRDMHVVVEKPAAGYMCSLSMCARVPLPPDELYALLIDPSECLRVFKTLKRVTHRNVIADDGQGNRTVEVDQTGAWRFLCFRGNFTVRMVVEQRKHDRTISFRLARSGFMKDFTGTWQIHPYDNASLDRLVNRHHPSPLHRLQVVVVSSLRAVEATLGLAGQQQDSLVQLQQSIAPAFAPPKAVARALERIAAKQIQKIMGDLQEEARRINAAAGAAAGAAGSSGGSGAAAEEQEASGGKRRGKHGQAAGDAPATPTLAQQRQGKKHLLAHVTPLD